MRLDEPHWWYAGERRLIASALRPVSAIWDYLGRRRFAGGEAYQSALPVLCVGNFTAGGSGKTPLAVYLAARLSEQGLKPYLLTRGYGGRIRGPHPVDVERDEPDGVGDESLLLARRASTIVARDRVAGARWIEAAAAATGERAVIIMDDGLQNPSLAKDLRIALVDGRRGLGNALVMPAGPLRMSLEFQLGLADVIIVNHQVSAPVAAQSASVTWLRDRYRGPVLSACQRAVGDTSWLKGAEVIAFAGIANPARFFELVERLGGRCRGRIAFPDHHSFSDAEAADLVRQHRSTGADLVTTEKDAVRLRGRGLEELRALTRVVQIETVLAEEDEARLALLIEMALQRALERAGKPFDM